jgi:hypothetical protein
MSLHSMGFIGDWYEEGSGRKLVNSYSPALNAVQYLACLYQLRARRAMTREICHYALYRLQSVLGASS